jgi:hypothetical protein
MRAAVFCSRHHLLRPRKQFRAIRRLGGRPRCRFRRRAAARAASEAALSPAASGQSRERGTLAPHDPSGLRAVGGAASATSGGGETMAQAIAASRRGRPRQDRNVAIGLVRCGSAPVVQALVSDVPFRGERGSACGLEGPRASGQPGVRQDSDRIAGAARSQERHPAGASASRIRAGRDDTSSDRATKARHLLLPPRSSRRHSPTSEPSGSPAFSSPRSTSFDCPPSRPSSTAPGDMTVATARRGPGRRAASRSSFHRRGHPSVRNVAESRCARAGARRYAVWAQIAWADADHATPFGKPTSAATITSHELPTGDDLCRTRLVLSALVE